MEEQKSFKERVKEVVIQCSKKYKKYYVDHEYLICSSAFTICSYYIIAAHKDNYLHLTVFLYKINSMSTMLFLLIKYLFLVKIFS